MSENPLKPGTTPPFPIPRLDTTGRPIWEVQAPIAMTEPGPFEPVYLFLGALALGTIMIAGIYIAFTVLGPLIWP